MPLQRLLIASENKKKLVELSRLLAPVGVEVVLPSSIGGLPPVDEDRPTFSGNAEKKAVSATRASGLWALADDSGLEVHALDGAPGVRSARFAGKHGDDAANNAHLLELLANVPRAQRGARFVCALALARPDGSVALVIEGTARGEILFAPRGDGDFGYDPLFLFTEPGFAQTGKGFAELSLDDKSLVSHRGRALREFASRLATVAGFGRRS
ncbi:MAG: non-canonical purine NTP pyrophosphatase [Planctomycetes bacterium]|nr:non-canonical purine NTP pyrophosphatase [Planctomycetota bacterium]